MQIKWSIFQDFGLKVQSYVKVHPNTKERVEVQVPMKISDKTHAYQGKFTFAEFHDFV